MIGIYKITNKDSGKIYIGRAEDIEKRWKKHKYDLNKCIHINKGLQESYNNDNNSLKFEVIEECTQEEYRYKELYYIMSSDRDLYNVVTPKDRIVYYIYAFLLEHVRIEHTDIEIDFKTEKCRIKRPLNWNLMVKDKNSDKVVLFNLWKYIPYDIESQIKSNENNEIRRKFVCENPHVHMINLEYTDETDAKTVAKMVLQEIIRKLF